MAPVGVVRRQLLIKDLKVFLRDVSQWSQLLLLMALVLVYLYNFSVLDLERVPYMSGVLKNVYAFLNLGMAGFVMATVAVRFVFPAGLRGGRRVLDHPYRADSAARLPVVEVLVGAGAGAAAQRGLTVAGNQLLGVDPFLKQVSAVTIVFMAFALCGLATGLGARYPRFAADNPSQVAGSYGGVAFMILAVLFVIVTIALVGWPSSVYLFQRVRRVPLEATRQALMVASFAAAILVSLCTFWFGMRTGVQALEEMDRTPS
jgi:ABC-2 type transport system permease protein